MDIIIRVSKDEALAFQSFIYQVAVALPPLALSVVGLTLWAIGGAR